MAAKDSTAGGVLALPQQAAGDPTSTDPAQVDWNSLSPDQQAAVKAYVAAQAPAPPAPAAPAGILPTPGQGLPGALGGILGLPFNVIAGVGSEWEARALAARQQIAQSQAAIARIDQQRAGLIAFGKTLASARDVALFNADPIGFINAKMAGETPRNMGPGDSIGDAGGIYATAPVVGFDKDTGRGYSVNGQGALTSGGATTGPTTSIDSTTGAVYDPRGGGMQGFISKFQSNPAGNRDSWTTPAFAPINGQLPAPGFPSGLAGAPSGDSTAAGASPPGQNGQAQSGATLTDGPIVPAHVPGGANAPRGLRNNNAGNLKPLPNGQQWQGQVGMDRDGYLQFRTPTDGVRAALITLRNKQAMHGLNTIGQIIAQPHVGWDPGNRSYANYVAQRAGIPVNAPIDLSDNATAQKVLNGIFAFENGAKAASAIGTNGPVTGTQAASATGGSASASSATPASTRTPGGTTTVVNPGTKVGPLSAQESAALGAPPGTILQRNPDGTVSAVVQRNQTALPDADQSRLNDIKELSLKYSRLSQLAQQFVALNGRQDTGGLIRGFPGEADVESSINPTIGTMNSLTKEMIPLQREVGQGPIRIGEVAGPGGGIWGGDVPRVQAPRETNAAIAQNWDGIAKQCQDYASFADQWAATHSTLNGMDAAWAKQNGGTMIRLPTPPAATNGPVRLNPRDPDADYQALPSGARYIGPDGRLRVK